MKKIGYVIQSLWWLSVSYIPIAVMAATQALYVEIGCGPGDCYEAGWLSGIRFEFTAIFAGGLIWPVAIWFLGGRWLCKQIRMKSTTSGEKPDA